MNMKKEVMTTSGRIKMMFAKLAIVMGVIMIIAILITGTLGSQSYATILYFERLNPVYEECVDAGTAQEDLGLPPSLRAVFEIAEKIVNDEVPEEKIEEKIEEIEDVEGNAIYEHVDAKNELGVYYHFENEIERNRVSGEQIKAYETIAEEIVAEDIINDENAADEKGFQQTEPPIGEDVEYDYHQYGYVAPEDEEQLRETDQLVIYTLYCEDGGEDYRVYGTVDGADEAFYACDENGNITGIVLDVPVTWYGAYDSDIPGTYTFTARIDGFNYSGVMPIAEITVNPDETAEEDNEEDGEEDDDCDESEEISEEISLMRARGMDYTIDLNTLTADTSGTGWNYVHTTTKLTFYGNHAKYGSASDNKYTLIKSGTSPNFTRHIEISADVNNISVIYDGSRITMTYYSSTNTYGAFNSNVTVKGGVNNAVTFENTYNFGPGKVTVDSNAAGTIITYNGSNNPDATMTNNGANTSVIFENVKSGFSTALTHNNTVSALDLRFRGDSTFSSAKSSSFTAAANTAINLLLSGSTSIPNGHITVPDTAKLIIDSADSPGSENGSLSIKQNNSSSACIGGSTTDSGKIIINGGTLDIKQTGSSNGAAIGGGTGKAGNVTINGGKITATGVSGAGIGGGYGMSGAGNVTINGGTVIAKATGGGAGIGGGGAAGCNVILNRGDVTAGAGGGGAGIGGGSGNNPSSATNTGIVNVTIGGPAIKNDELTVTVAMSNGTGAGIGGGESTNSASNSVSGNANVVIHSGKITVDAGYGHGAGIGGGGSSNNVNIPGAGFVTIHGGDLVIKADSGACIGNGGALKAITGSGTKGSVTIDGGKILADFGKGNGIGTGGNNCYYPLVNISTTADIVAFGREISNFPGIDTGDSWENEGSGYFVNANFDKEHLGVKGMLVVYEKSNPTVPVRVAYSPDDFYVFSFTTGIDYSKDYYVYTGTYSGALRQIICKGTPAGKPKHDEAEIFSVKKPFVYHSSGHTTAQYFRSMSVTYGEGGSYNDKIHINEYYVDIAGNKLEGIKPNPGMTLVSPNDAYTKTGIPSVTDYTYIGYKWDKKPDGDADIKSGTPSGEKITAERTIYFVYAPYIETDVTVSKTVTGEFANKTTAFKFTVRFTDSKGVPLKLKEPFEYEGGAFAGSETAPSLRSNAPADGTLSLNTNGEATFTLKHGQKITIKKVPANVMIQIIETRDSIYAASFKDSLDNSVKAKNDTGALTVGAAARTFDFVNERIIIVPTGIDAGIWIPAAILPLAGLIILSCVIILNKLSAIKRVRRKTWKI